MATLSDVAAAAGVSVSAVSRVLSNAPSARVSPETRERIQDAARRLSYRPNFAARALRFSRTNVIALVVPDLTNAIFTELTRGVEEEASELGYMILLARADGVRALENQIPQLIGEGKVDGVLLQVGEAAETEEMNDLLEANLPAVLINSTRHEGLSSVALEDAAGASIATRRLLELGHSRIALINGLPTSDTAGRRGEGFRATMSEAGLSVPEHYVTALGYAPDHGREALRVLASLPEPPSAIVVANVNAALGALLEARALGLRVPEDLSIIAIHDAWTAENSWPPLTTVRMPLYEMGREAVASLWERLTEGTVRDRVVTDPPPILIERGSTAAPAG